MSRPKRRRRRYPYGKYPERITFLLSAHHLEELENLAEQAEVSKSDLVRKLVVKHLNNKRKTVFALSSV